MDTPLPGGAQHLWGIDWKSHFPVENWSGCRVECVEYATCEKFMQTRFRQIFNKPEGDCRFLSFSDHRSRLKFHLTMSDCFGFFDEKTMVGCMVANPSDWSTYYIRMGAFLPEYQAKGLSKAWITTVVSALAAHSVERIETDVEPANQANATMLIRAGWIPTGMQLSERWGAITRFTYYISKNHKTVFHRQFSDAMDPNLKEVGNWNQAS